ncbi:unnamed protein product [Arabidopsis thaliana]|uniref:non-specific serine/threonine protein kinase n=1 Tax=Arabidopsis thaliana TaxID=3702 RepID=A0A7G2EBA3_ARATH|nr:unnamed protein product [Arabidopsis thaliana]
MLRESDGEMSLGTTNSPISSGTESCSSFSRLSFDAPPSTIPEEESFLSLKPHRSSDFAYAEIRRRKKQGLTFRDFRLMRRIGAGDIGTVYLCPVESSSSSPENQQLRSPRRFTRLARLFQRVLRSKKVQTLEPTRLFVAEPVTARSGSFVGTHEYVAPEVASGGSHGNAVDWWAFGVFLYEMIYGKTPFVAPTNDVILRNIVKRQLSFPTDSPATMFELHARNLISGLLNKDPTKRLGSRRGAAEVKVHPFFKGLNFALIRTLTPPEIPSSVVKKPMKSATFSGRSSNKPAAFDYF